MPLVLVESTHVRVICDACRSASAEVCAKRDLDVTAKIGAVPKFKRAGWHHDPGRHGRVRALEMADREGAGRWYCPTCARKTHL
jgi:hypothetical protein